MTISIIQLVIPVLYITYISVKKSAQNSKKKKNEEEEEDDDETIALEAVSRREAIDNRRRSRYKKSIAKYEEQLSIVRDKIETSKSRGKSNPKDKASRDLLVRKLKEENSELSDVGSSIGGESDSDSVNSSN
jgi:hypothetical protein